MQTSPPSFLYRGRPELKGPAAEYTPVRKETYCLSKETYSMSKETYSMSKETYSLYLRARPPNTRLGIYNVYNKRIYIWHYLERGCVYVYRYTHT